MELYAKGQLSFLILNCLLERDFYGLDIITEIKARTSGNVDLKKPSVYSNLTRMEKQGQVSSYMRSSELGPNRRYYSITDKGRQTYQELKDEFERNHIDVFKDFRGDFDPITLSEPVRQMSISDAKIEEENSQTNENDISDDESDFFDFSSLNSPADAAQPVKVQDEMSYQAANEEQFVENQKAFEFAEQENEEFSASTFEERNDDKQTSVEETETIIEESAKAEEQQDKQEKVEEKNDAVFLTNEAAEYNQRIYDISKDINKYRRRRSFAEDQIAISVEAPLKDSEERTRQKVEEFKSSLLENKNKYAPAQPLFYERKQPEMAEIKEEAKDNTPVQDDGIFITSRLNDSQILKAKKIDPPRVRFESAPQKDKLPPPKRDVSIDPSHKEIISRLYSKSRQADSVNDGENILYDYDDLKNYYGQQNIKFSSYSKNESNFAHNTNKLSLISSLIVFLMFAGLSAISFAVLNAFDMLNVKTNFLFILIPALYIFEVIYHGYNVLRHTSWEPNPMMKQLYLWGITLVGTGLVVGLNFAFGMGVENFATYAATLILPILAILMVFPVRYYISRTILIKYWR